MASTGMKKAERPTGSGQKSISSFFAKKAVKVCPRELLAMIDVPDVQPQ